MPQAGRNNINKNPIRPSTKTKLSNLMCHPISKLINLGNFKILDRPEDTQSLFLQINKRRPVRLLICKERVNKSIVSLKKYCEG